MEPTQGFSRRELLSWIGKTAGAVAMYQAMTTLGFAAESNFDSKNYELSGAPAGASVLVLGGGLAGMTAAYELRKAGYKVKILEYNQKAGGRCWTLRGGDKYTELGGATQECKFDKGLYLNPGPWRIPYHHHAVLHYCKQFDVKLEVFTQINHNAYFHSTKAFGGKPKRYREVKADFQGHVAELLAKCVNQKALDQAMTKEDTERLLLVMREWGALNDDGKYVKSVESSLMRGFDIDPAGGLMPEQQFSQPMGRAELLNSTLWKHLNEGHSYDYQATLFQPIGGMDMIAKAFEKEVGSLIRYSSKVTKIDQDDNGVTVNYVDSLNPGETMTETADWCVCTIPLSILGQIPSTFSSKLTNAIRAVPYDSSVKVGLQFKRRFWEEDDHIYGGITFTDMPIELISYPSTDYHSSGKGVLLGAYLWDENSYEFTSMTPEMRVKKALEYGAKIHPQYMDEYDNGISVAWHRVPWVNGCYGLWTPETRKAHYKNLCEIDGRVVLAGEHASYIPAWMEGAILSSLDAIKRLHQHALQSKKQTA
ncbi:flavin monoamine oxidase family protein [uncultured Marinobacter sp.]|uniref:flavin monoamine oxidase family protein n=1 Tax=uncultured Marinobacter sp. TaxID=187379 RepID=UPI002601E0A8|nr:flavin monoamine oxidase family protein [uncultured Marinobacter sp.]